jgi:hypothetical protein
MPLRLEHRRHRGERRPAQIGVAQQAPRRHAPSSSRHNHATHDRGQSSATDHPGTPSYATRNNTRPPPF